MPKIDLIDLPEADRLCMLPGPAKPKHDTGVPGGKEPLVWEKDPFAKK